MSDTAFADEEEITDVDPALDFNLFKQQVEDFLMLTQNARELSEKCRDYVDGKQWTEDQVAQLRRRKQAPIVNNRIKAKQQGLLGLTVVRKTDPKAYPRNQHDAPAAEAVTDGLRYVAERADFTSTKLTVVDNFFCEGYGGAIIAVEQMKKGDIEITIEELNWDRIYFDPHSRKKDFTDARYKGYVTWLDEDDLLDRFPDADVSALTTYLTGIGDTFEDRPVWMTKEANRRRYLVCTHYYKIHDQWTLCIFTGGGFLLNPTPSPYLNTDGEPVCPIELVSGYIDRNNNRYSEISTFLDLQDEINHRRSKALFLLSQRQTFGTRGAIADVMKAKTELAKPDGHLEVTAGEFNKDFGILPTGDMAQGQFELLQEAKAEIDSQSYNAQLSGSRQSGDLSGVAIQKLQSAGVTELNSLFQALTNWELRVYRQCWDRIRQFWTAEKWVRVTDDQKNLRWVGFNTQMTLGQVLQETMADESLPLPMRLGASATLIQLEQNNPQQLMQIQEVRNKTAELDVDIILDQSFDTVNIQAEQLDALLKFGAGQQMDIVDLIDLSNITGKDDLIDRIKSRRTEMAQGPAQQAQQQVAQLESQLKNKDADTQLKAGELQLKNKELDLKQVELQIQAAEVAQQANQPQPGVTPTQPVVDPVDAAKLDLQTRDQMFNHYAKNRELDLKEQELNQNVAPPVVAAPTSKNELLAKLSELEQMEMSKEVEDARMMQLEQQKCADEQAERDERKAQSDALLQGLAGIQQLLGGLIASIEKPKVVVRDANGQIAGVK